MIFLRGEVSRRPRPSQWDSVLGFFVKVLEQRSQLPLALLAVRIMSTWSYWQVPCNLEKVGCLRAKNIERKSRAERVSGAWHPLNTWILLCLKAYLPWIFQLNKAGHFFHSFSLPLFICLLPQFLFWVVLFFHFLRKNLEHCSSSKNYFSPSGPTQAALPLRPLPCTPLQN